ncbi:hypothetical protein QP162_08140 [Sphingomonas aurantiaca]|uniref:hypothetical protein n=1 Tax=Sphingomonas aurantiaca TaxID=185949 RepID=UPI002FDFE2BF
MPKVSTTTDYAARDASIAINSYTTVLRRPRVPHDVFATYWRDVHGPLCSRIPGLAWYVQNHLDREQDAHLWPVIDGIAPFADYELDGGVEIGFASKADQDVFNAASHILFADEQNMFAATVAYALPDGSRTLVDRFADPIPNGDDGFDRIHVHIGAAGSDAETFATFMTEFAETLAADAAVLKLRLHLPERYDNAEPAPPAPNVDHEVPAERSLIAVLELRLRKPADTPRVLRIRHVHRDTRRTAGAYRLCLGIRGQRRLYLCPRQAADHRRASRQPPGAADRAARRQ